MRGGYALAGGSLLYARAGAVRTSFDLYDTVNARTDAAEDDDTTETGMRLGFGTDIPATRHLFLRLEYSFTEYDDFEADIVDSQDQAQTERFRPREDLFRVGLGWQWGGSGELRATQASDYTGLYAGAHIGHGALQSHVKGQTNDGERNARRSGTVPLCWRLRRRLGCDRGGIFRLRFPASALVSGPGRGTGGRQCRLDL